MKLESLILISLLLTSSCIKNPLKNSVDEEDDSSEEKIAFCCYTSSTVIQDSAEDFLINIEESNCTGGIMNGTFQRGNCSTSGTLSEGYCKVGNDKKVFYKTSSYDVNTAQTSCPNNSVNDVNGVWVNY